MYGRVVGVTAEYHSTKLRDLDRDIALMWLNVAEEVGKETDRSACDELCVARGTILQSICSMSAIQLEEIRETT